MHVCRPTQSWTSSATYAVKCLYKQKHDPGHLPILHGHLPPPMLWNAYKEKHIYMDVSSENIHKFTTTLHMYIYTNFNFVQLFHNTHCMCIHNPEHKWTITNTYTTDNTNLTSAACSIPRIVLYILFLLQLLCNTLQGTIWMNGKVYRKYINVHARPTVYVGANTLYNPSL